MISVSATNEDARRIAMQAYDLLADEQPLRTTTSEIRLEAAEGTLAIKGRVRTNNHRNLAQRLAQTAVDGWQLRNELISDEALTLELAAKLAMDPRTATANMRNEIFLGVAHLKGVVESREQRQAVLELAQQIPGITSVNDLLTVVG